MPTVERVAESFQNIDEGTKLVLAKEIIELARHLDDDETIIEDGVAKRLERQGLLVATNKRFLFLSSPSEEYRKSLVEEFSYEEITNIETALSDMSSSVTVWTREISFSFKEIDSKIAEKLSRYVCSRSFCDKKPLMLSKTMESASPKLTKVTSASSRDTSLGAGVSLLDQQTTWWNIKNSLHIIFALVPFFLTFLSFLTMGYRAKVRKYYIFSALYFIPIFFIYQTNMAQWSVGLTVFSWFMGVIHSLLSRREYLTYLVNDENRGIYQELESTKLPEQQALKGFLQEKASLEPVEDASSANQFIKKMQQLNIAIEDPVISDYLDEMEKICKEIFKYIEKYPDKKDQIQYLVTYYLPETFKLLESYDELSHKAVKTEIINQAMREITESLAIILEAFINLYNSLYQDKALHISTDIKVLKDILTQHGLTKNSSEFELKK